MMCLTSGGQYRSQLSSWLMLKESTKHTKRKT